MPTPLNFRNKLRKLLFDTFNRDEFALLIKDELEVIYTDLVTPGKRETEFDDVIEALERRNRLPELLRAAIKSRPENVAFVDLQSNFEIVTAQSKADEIVTAHSKAVEELKGQGKEEIASSVASLPRAMGLQTSVVATASMGDQTISLEAATRKLHEASRRICVIEVPGQSIGTGFLIGPRHILTNRHVLDEALRRNAGNICAVFDHTGDQAYDKLPRRNIDLAAATPMDDVNDLDYAVLQLNSDVESDRGYFSACTDHLNDKSSITIIGHPVNGSRALGLQYSWGMIRDINDQASRIAYTAQTSPGSSGSPVLNANFELVGLHHHGQAGVNNHGIPILAIVASLKQRGLLDILKELVVPGFTPSNEAIASSGSGLQSQASPPRKKEIVLLLHGIRTFANWQPMVKRVLGEIPNFEVVGIKFGYLDILRFWFPFWTRQASIDDIRHEIQNAKVAHPDANISVIAHSFGTYAISQILLDDPVLKFHRMVLSGSIVPRSYRWEYVRQKLATDVLNDYGTRDIWPVLAKSLSWFYGDTGRHGFGRGAYVIDRGHNYVHSDFFTEEFVRTFWKPWFQDGVFVPSKWEEVAPPPSWLLSVLSVLPLKTLAAFLVGWSVYVFSKPPIVPNKIHLVEALRNICKDDYDTTLYGESIEWSGLISEISSDGEYVVLQVPHEDQGDRPLECKYEVRCYSDQGPVLLRKYVSKRVRVKGIVGYPSKTILGVEVDVKHATIEEIK